MEVPARQVADAGQRVARVCPGLLQHAPGLAHIWRYRLLYHERR